MNTEKEDEQTVTFDAAAYVAGRRNDCAAASNYANRVIELTGNLSASEPVPSSTCSECKAVWFYAEEPEGWRCSKCERLDATATVGENQLNAAFDEGLVKTLKLATMMRRVGIGGAAWVDFSARMEAANAEREQTHGANPNEVDVSDLDPIELFQALYDRARPQGQGFAHFTPESLTREEATKILGEAANPGFVHKEGTTSRAGFVDYCRGRCMKVQMGATIDFRLYDRDTYEGAGQNIVDELRARKQVP